MDIPSFWYIICNFYLVAVQRHLKVRLWAVVKFKGVSIISIHTHLCLASQQKLVIVLQQPDTFSQCCILCSASLKSKSVRASVIPPLHFLGSNYFWKSIHIFMSFHKKYFRFTVVWSLATNKSNRFALVKTQKIFPIKMLLQNWFQPIMWFPSEASSSPYVPPILEIAQSNALQLVNTYSPVSEIEYKFHPGVIPIKTSCKS